MCVQAGGHIRKCNLPCLILALSCSLYVRTYMRDTHLVIYVYRDHMLVYVSSHWIYGIVGVYDDNDDQSEANVSSIVTEPIYCCRPEATDEESCGQGMREIDNFQAPWTPILYLSSNVSWLSFIFFFFTGMGRSSWEVFWKQNFLWQN